ncbi:MAG: excinuclease ABC subunit UvrA [Acidobacteriota bacterium]
MTSSKTISYTSSSGAVHVTIQGHTINRRLQHQHPETLVVKGARVHNLKNIHCEIDHNSLTVITGVSGSGKSSLAFDTLYAEGQRRYIESMSAYARQFLERIEKPDVDEVLGIAPAIAIKQKNSVRNPRSTVGTVTEIYDYLRLLYSRVGKTFCWQCQQEVRRDLLEDAAQVLLSLPPETRIYVLFPLTAYRKYVELKTLVTKERKGRKSKDRSAELFQSVLHDLRKHGFMRLYQNRTIFDLSSPEAILSLDLSGDLEVLVDRIVIRHDIRQRLMDTLETCYHEGSGQAIIEIVGLPEQTETSDGKGALQVVPRYRQLRPVLKQGDRFVFNERFTCQNCNIQFEDPEPRLFSFNSPFGACPHCQGFGNTIDFDPNLVVPDKRKTLQEGAIEPWTKPRYRSLLAEFKRFCRRRGIPLDVPYESLTPEQKELIHLGDDTFIGIQRFFDHLETKKYKLYIRVFLSRYRGYTLCGACQGARLRREARAVKLAGKPINEVTAMTVAEAHRFFQHITLSPFEATVGQRILDEIRNRLTFLFDVGLDYLSLDRLASTLSGGEAQRIQLATSLGASLVGALYVLDEPSIGLHPRDNARLIGILKNLRDLGNTVLVVEHESEMMRASDRIIDLGPGAGEQGGQVVFSGTYPELLNTSQSLTGRYLKGDLKIHVPAVRLTPKSRWLRIFGASEHNLKGVDVEIPLGLMTCITGVSGSGKSTLVHEVLYQAIKAARGEATPRENYQRMEGDQWLEDVILVDQSPIGRTPRSNPITYIKAFDVIRELFASTREARAQSFGPGYFSFNLPGGRCETCEGDGTVTVEMQFLADVELICEDCKGQRFKPAVLDVRYKGRNIFEVLQMTVREALTFFSSFPKITNRLKVLQDVGLGYLRLGQSATTLSGGEAQRVKLAYYLSRQINQKTLFIFDEPTTGLHFDDIHKLLLALRKLIESGATLVIIEHNLDVIKTADWVIDLGPEGGNRGGQVVGAGPPEDIARLPHSYTGQYLKTVLVNP